MKQTAVEWLIDQLTEYNYLWLTDKPDDMSLFLTIVPQAKELERTQIEDAYTKGYEHRDFSYFDPDNYYADTFRSK